MIILVSIFDLGLLPTLVAELGTLEASVVYLFTDTFSFSLPIMAKSELPNSQLEKQAQPPETSLTDAVYGPSGSTGRRPPGTS